MLWQSWLGARSGGPRRNKHHLMKLFYYINKIMKLVKTFFYIVILKQQLLRNLLNPRQSKSAGSYFPKIFKYESLCQNTWQWFYNSKCIKPFYFHTFLLLMKLKKKKIIIFRSLGQTPHHQLPKTVCSTVPSNSDWQKCKPVELQVGWRGAPLASISVSRSAKNSQK